ncbi:MAG TPA: lipopolysaccharide assembly protein LapA domain-containing protein [Nocardia sp.]|uniref:LapA family protein n=1 Tax=Nocardia TaxID=1817 RepID=UPI002453B21A|nr:MULTISPECIES: lipopolysaccharide assembly protein LapA domain-containing protein [Nocardia]HLS79084.1 lipopolysaccharide assembly protein LapA domain-containing protein [Nocardia sp.]
MSANDEYEPPLVEPGEPGDPGLPEPESGREVSLTSRAGYAWTALVLGALILILLLVFILQNLTSVGVRLFFWEFTLPLGVAVLLSVIGGALVMALVGGVRILQLRRVAKR